MLGDDYLLFGSADVGQPGLLHLLPPELAGGGHRGAGVDRTAQGKVGELGLAQRGAEMVLGIVKF